MSFFRTSFVRLLPEEAQAKRNIPREKSFTTQVQNVKGQEEYNRTSLNSNLLIGFFFLPGIILT